MSATDWGAASSGAAEMISFSFSHRDARERFSLGLDNRFLAGAALKRLSNTLSHQFTFLPRHRTVVQYHAWRTVRLSHFKKGRWSIPMLTLVCRLLLAVLVVAHAVRAETSRPGLADDEARVGVLACDDFYYPNASFAFTADTCLDALRACGIPAEKLSPADLQDRQRFHPGRYPVLLQIYGDAFPEASLPDLRRYHGAGGCIVSNGVPYGFACRRTDRGWQGEYVPDERSPRQHDGMGTGWWLKIESVTGVRWAVSPADRPFQIKSFRPEDARIGDFFGLDQDNLPSEDRVVPMVVVDGPAQTAVAVGIIEHHCEAFDGAIDIWAGSHLFSEPRHQVIRTQEEIFVRACAYLLERRNVMTSDQRARVDEAMDARLAARPADPDPWPLPGKASPAPPERIVPSAAAPGSRLDVIDLRKASRDRQQAALSLAGLVNRRQAKLFVLCGDMDLDWLSYLVGRELPDTTARDITFDEALREYADCFKGAVVPPDASELFCGVNIAIMAAAAKDLIIANADLAERHGLAVVEDLRGRWRSSREAYEWIETSCAGALRSDIAAVYSPEKWLMTDYLVAQRVYTLWITGPRDAREAGSNTWDEIRLAYDRLAGMPLHAPVLGFGHHALYRGLGESEVVEMISRFAKLQVVTGGTPNLSVHGSLPMSALRQKRREAPKFRRDRVYVALVISDGDNLNYWYDRFPKLWKDPGRGTFPIGWSIGPSGMHLEPPFYRRIYAEATENDCFVAAVSGLAYVYPEIYGEGYARHAELLDQFVERTRVQMGLLDLRTIHVHHHGPYGELSLGTLEHYADVLGASGTDLMFVGYGRREWYPADIAAPRKVNGVPLSYAATQGRPEEAIGQIREAAGSIRPAFVCAHITPWRFKPAEFKRQFDELGPEYVLVTPEELGSLIRASMDGDDIERPH